MADAQNFSKTEGFIRKNPRQAEAQAFEWERFLKINAQDSAEILSIKTKEEFDRWALEHPEKHVDPSIWDGREISEYYRLRGQNKNEPMQESDKKELSKETNERRPERPEFGHSYTPEPLPPAQEAPTIVVSAPAPTESQGQQPSQPSRPSAGGINRGINTINNFARMGFRNPFGKIGQRVVGQTALRGLTAFFSSFSGVWVPIAITLVLVFVFTLIIVGFGGAPPLETSVQTPPTAMPTQAPIETPAP